MCWEYILPEHIKGRQTEERLFSQKSMAFSSTINTVYAVMHRHRCEAMVIQSGWYGLSNETSRLLYCDRAILDSMLFLAETW
jgi:hypothetical protein